MKTIPTADNWLVLTYYYGIDGLACSHHIEDRVAALNSLGIKTHTLSRANVNHAPFMRLETFSHYLSEFRQTSGFMRIKNGVNFTLAITRAAVLKTVEADEIFCFLDLVGQGQKLLQRKKFTQIYSTGGPLGAHIAALILATRYRLPLVIEFQDPLPFQYQKNFRRLALLIEKWALRRARCVFLTQQAAQAAALRCSTQKPAYIYPGAERIENVPRVSDHKPDKQTTFRLAHFGRLYQNRNTKHFLQALTQLPLQTESETCIELHCYGAFDRAAYHAIATTPALARRVLQMHEQVSRAKARQIMAEMDVLLLIQHVSEVSRETIPSKVYEYLHVGKPILALTYRNHELTTMLRELGHFAVEADNKDAIAQALEELLDSWRNGVQPLIAPSPYTTKKAARELIELAAKTRD